MCLVTHSCLTLCDAMGCNPSGSSVHGDFPGKNTEAGCHALLQGIFPTQGLKAGLPHCRQILHQLSYLGNPPFTVSLQIPPTFSILPSAYGSPSDLFPSRLHFSSLFLCLSFSASSSLPCQHLCQSPLWSLHFCKAPDPCVEEVTCSWEFFSPKSHPSEKCILRRQGSLASCSFKGWQRVRHNLATEYQGAIGPFIKAVGEGDGGFSGRQHSLQSPRAQERSQAPVGQKWWGAKSLNLSQKSI